MENFMDCRVPVPETLEGLQSLISTSSVPLIKLQSKIAPLLTLPMTTEEECDEARRQISTALDAPFIKMPANSLRMSEMLKFRDDVKVSVRSIGNSTRC
jgi:hypothetical protein